MKDREGPHMVISGMKEPMKAPWMIAKWIQREIHDHEGPQTALVWYINPMVWPQSALRDLQRAPKNIEKL